MWSCNFFRRNNWNLHKIQDKDKNGPNKELLNQVIKYILQENIKKELKAKQQNKHRRRMKEKIKTVNISSSLMISQVVVWIKGIFVFLQSDNQDFVWFVLGETSCACGDSEPQNQPQYNSVKPTTLHLI